MNYEWKPGMIAVCIIGCGDILIRGNKYPVTEVRTGCHDAPETDGVPSDGVNLMVLGAVPPFFRPEGVRKWWKATRFRPLDDGDIVEIKVKHSVPQKALT